MRFHLIVTLVSVSNPQIEAKLNDVLIEIETETSLWRSPISQSHASI